MTLWLGLCDSYRQPYHPTDVSRVNIETITWRWRPSPTKRWTVEMVNAANVDFHILRPIRGGRLHIAMFELFMDIEPCTPPLALNRDTPDGDAGETIRCAPGALVIENNFQQHLQQYRKQQR